jgi:hypothetical protein
MATTKQKRKTSVETRRKLSKKKTASLTQSRDLRGKDLERAVELFQTEPDQKKAHQQWKKLESSIFGVQFKD